MRFLGSAPPKDATRFDRREFLGLATAASFGNLLPKALGQTAAAAHGETSGLSLRIAGNSAEGYRTNILFHGEPIASSRPSELSAVFQNGERSIEDSVETWKAKSWNGNNATIALHGDSYLPNLNATIYTQVIYSVVTPNVLRKTIRLRQSDMFMLFYQLTNRVQPLHKPAKFWSFDQQDCRGGSLREYFPAAGFRTNNNICVGLLTDAGYRNGWSRMYRRDGKPIKPASAQIPDPNLYRVASHGERNNGDYYVQQTFGEELQQSPHAESQPVTLAAAGEWIHRGNPVVNRRGECVSISVTRPEDGLFIPFSGIAGKTYLVEFQYRSTTDLSVAIVDVDADLKQLQNFNQFNDGAPKSPDKWMSFRSTVFVPAVFGKTALLFSLPDVQQPLGSRLEIREVKLSCVPAHNQPYHRIQMDQPIEITTFLFVDENVPDTIGGYRLASQLHLADALYFKGDHTEKVLYADLMMLCWNVETEIFRPMLAPSIYYSAAGEMYLRDSFFALNGTHNKVLNESAANLWAENQGEDGAINTLVEPELTNLERKSNDSTPLWLMWVLLNRRRFGTAPPMEKVAKAAQYCLDTYDPHGDGRCVAKFVMGQLDIVSYPEGTSIICQNQGLLAVVLRVIRELHIPQISDSLSDQRLEQAEELYRSYYDPVRKFVIPSRNVVDAIGFAELFPEYLSLWLFNKKILTDEMVVNHLDRIPVMMPHPGAPFPEMGGTVRPIFIGLTDQPGGWRFFTEAWHPLSSDSYAKGYANGQMNGVYYNGGSWMRIEICGYVAGKLHGWTVADKAIKNRMWAEINTDPDFPTSQEYLATDPRHPFFGSHRVFAWNSFVLQALEMAGMRSPEMDPDYNKL